jgi:hypothetical protein
MRKLLDISDRKTRLLQQGLMAACGFLAGVATVLLLTGALPALVAGLIVAGAVALFVVAAGIKQRWEIEYRGHRIRFENSPVTGERLFLDEGLVAKGGFGMKVELRAPIRVGDGAGDAIVALVDAGVREFRLRLFVETEEFDSAHAAALVQPSPVAAPSSGYAEAAEDLRPVTESAVLGKITLAKNALELLASVIGVIGGLTALATWLL